MTFATEGPVEATVVICAYHARQVISGAIASLRAQDIAEAFEVVVVVSGDDGTAELVAEFHPDVRLIAAAGRLYPGAARNRGVRAAHGAFIAFLPADGVACPSWLRLRIEKHRAGFPLVGGAISNGTPTNLVGTADYYVEYAASLPICEILRRQSIPHTLSYERSVFAEVGLFPELELPGEDTVFNGQCMRTGMAVGFEPGASIAHRNITGLRHFVSHQRDHGRGLAQCVVHYDLGAPFSLDGGRRRRALTTFVRYPLWRWTRTLRLLGRGAPSHLPIFLFLSPLIAAGYVGAAHGVWEELQSR